MVSMVSCTEQISGTRHLEGCERTDVGSDRGSREPPKGINQIKPCIVRCQTSPWDADHRSLEVPSWPLSPQMVMDHGITGKSIENMFELLMGVSCRLSRQPMPEIPHISKEVCQICTQYALIRIDLYSVKGLNGFPSLFVGSFLFLLHALARFALVKVQSILSRRYFT